MSSRRGLSIRTAGPAEAAEVAELLASAGCVTTAPALAPQLAAMAAGSGVALAAWEWGPPSGLVVLHWFDALHVARRIAQIDVLVVAPDARRRGLGRLLVKAAAQAARVAGCGLITLAVGADDEATTAFSVATGFAVDGVRVSRPLRKRA